MRVLRVAQRIPPLRGGKEIHVAELSRRQVELGDDVVLVFSEGDPSELGVKCIRVRRPALPARMSGGLDAFVFAAMAAFMVRRERFDVIHVHGDFLETIPFSVLARIRGIPLVLTVHGGMNAKYRRLARASFARVSRVIALGQSVAEELIGMGISRSRVIPMSSGVDLERLERSQTDVEPSPGLIVCVGTLDRVKNFETVIQAFMTLGAPVERRLEIIGTGPEESSLKALAEDCPQVRFLGELSRDEVYRKVATADAFVLASRRLPTKGEGVSTALLEAMALGKLCLVSSEAEPAPVVPDSAAYAVFDPNDVKQLGGLMFRSLTDAQWRSEKGRRARESVRHLDWWRNTERIRAVLTDALTEETR